jgi:hypothetical protein
MSGIVMSANVMSGIVMSKERYVDRGTIAADGSSGWRIELPPDAAGR